MEKNRCFGSHSKLYSDYHDFEWGRVNKDDRYLFEMLILEGAQAGLSWEIVLKRREAYKRAYHQFDPVKVAKMSDSELEELLENKDLIRNRMKIFTARQNARVFLEIQKEFGSFASYLWSFIGVEQIQQDYDSFSEVPCSSKESIEISLDLKKRGMNFVGPKIIYSFMQAVGMINDHVKSCFCYEKK